MSQPAEDRSDTKLLEAMALSGQHLVKCSCGYLASSPDPDTVVAISQSHQCPATPIDVITDRVFSIPGLVALIAAATIAFALAKLV